MTRYLWAVRYRRRGWKSRQVRFFLTQHAAYRHVAKLRRGSPDLRPLVQLIIERRELGPVEVRLHEVSS